ncbi:M20/M25/M40 family metallo-hydrolase [Nonomuraea sp. NPDC059194]|uniref:M20/M25/M40 family metallo-hydrolase n=1 Tax=Nonomuraea sp. NPDC059194 TaxID=3346764 RepID=UPI0036AEFFB5
MRKLIDTPHRLVAGIMALLVTSSVVVGTAMTEAATPTPVPASAPADTFSSDRALSRLKEFATEPRPLGSAASDRAKDYLVERLRAQGLTVEVQRAVGARTGDGLAIFGRTDNVVATLPGTNPSGTVLVVAHYDSVPTGPGAADDAAAVAAMLETTRALAVQGPLRNDVVLLITDGEEDGLLGADAFAREHPLGRRGGVVLNWEDRGVSGPSLMFQTSKDNARLIELFTDAVPRPRGDSSMVEIYRLLPNDTDFTVLAKAGFSGLNSAFVEEPARYHTADDSIARLSRSSLQHHGTNMLALTRAFGQADLRTLATDHDSTYFAVFGFVISYSNVLVLPLAALAVLLLAGLVAVARRQAVLSLPRTLVAMVSAVVPVAVSVVLAQAMWTALVALRPGYEPMDGLLYRPLSYELAIMALTALALLCWYLPLRRRLGPAALAVGSLAWLCVLAVLCAVTAPGAAFVFTVPALLGALGGLLALVLRRFPVWSVVTMCAGTVGAALTLPSLAFGSLGATGLTLGGIGAVLFTGYGFALLPVIELLFPAVDRGVGRLTAVAVPSTAMALALALVGTGLAVDGFDREHPESAHLAYVLDADTGVASWVSADAEPAGWTRRHVTGHDLGRLPDGYARGNPWTGPARAIDVEGPRVKLSARKGDVLTLHVASARAASSVTLRLDQPIAEVSASVSGDAPVAVPVTGTRSGGWPGEIRLRDLPAGGADVTVRVARTGQVRITAMDETHGLSALPGFTPRPPGLQASIRADGDLVVVTRAYAF